MKETYVITELKLEIAQYRPGIKFQFGEAHAIRYEDTDDNLLEERMRLYKLKLKAMLKFKETSQCDVVRLNRK
jgi:hypothetical protein